ncbi:MAG: ferredoxin [Spirochaetes bacterium]|nr:ferredoxin [Spirochaetota bacterium]
MKAYVNKDTCTGCGLCVDICSNVFSMEGDIAVAITDEISDADKNSCKEAAEQCPVEAIKIEGY